MNLDQICKIQPRVRYLFDRCVSLSHSTMNEGERDRVWYRELKPVLVSNVGFLSTTPELANTEAYDSIYHHCIELAKI